jgi:cell division protein FtsB
MYTNNLLKKQVRSELKRRRYMTYTLLFLSILYVMINIVFSDMGLMRYLELGQKKAALNQEIASINEENQKLRHTLNTYKENDFYLEKHAREDFGLAGPDEYIFLYEKEQ